MNSLNLPACKSSQVVIRASKLLVALVLRHSNASRISA